MKRASGLFAVLLSAGLSWAAEPPAPPDSPGWWRKKYPLPDSAGVTAVVIQVDDKEKAERALSHLCRRLKCATAERPGWYFTGQDEIRTQNERFYAVAPDKLERFKREALELGRPLQVHRTPAARLSAQDLEDIRLKRENLSKELVVLNKDGTKVPGITGLAAWTLSHLDRVWAAHEEAERRELVNVRLMLP